MTSDYREVTQEQRRNHLVYRFALIGLAVWQNHMFSPHTKFAPLAKTLVLPQRPLITFAVIFLRCSSVGSDLVSGKNGLFKGCQPETKPLRPAQANPFRARRVVPLPSTATPATV